VSIDALLRMAETRQGTPDPSFEGVEIRTLFHRLNNQLGVVLAHAELLEAKASDPTQRKHSAQVVAATLHATSLARALRSRLDGEYSPLVSRPSPLVSPSRSRRSGRSPAKPKAHKRDR
jgi:hypothetical protein